MAHIDKTKKLRPSILDRLIDDEPQVSLDPGGAQRHSVKQLRNTLRRDIENLLNTRCCLSAPPEDLGEVERSMFNYGLPDLATVNVIDAKKREEFMVKLQRALMQFEPRFKSVKVTCSDNAEQNDRALHFRIDAVVFAEPQPEVIVFDSTLETVSRTVSVKEL